MPRLNHWWAGGALAFATVLSLGQAAVGQSPDRSAPPPAAVVSTASPPPEWLDAAAIPWYGSPDRGMFWADEAGIWTARLDGGDMRLLGPSNMDTPPVASGGRVITTRRGDGGRSELVVYSPDGTEQVLLRGIVGGAIALDADGDTAYVWGEEGTDRVGALIRVPLDWGEVEEGVLPKDSCCRAVVSADGRSLAGAPHSHMSPGRIVARFDGGPVRRLFLGWPIGFDALGRLVAWDFRRVVRYDPVTREVEPLRTADMRLTRNAHVSPDGRYLVAIPDGLNLHILDLIDGDRRTIPLVPPRQWSSGTVAFHGDLAVFEGVDWPTFSHAVVSLQDGWVAYVSRAARD